MTAKKAPKETAEPIEKSLVKFKHITDVEVREEETDSVMFKVLSESPDCEIVE